MLVQRLHAQINIGVCGYMQVRLYAIHWQASLSVFFQRTLKNSIINSSCVCFLSMTKFFISNKKNLAIKHKKKKVYIPFMDGIQLPWRLEPLQGGSLLFTSKFPDIPGIYFINLRRMNSWVDLGASQWFWTWDPWIGNQAP